MINPAWRLSLAGQRVYDVLCYTLRLHERTHVSHADIAAAGNLSEGTVSRVMPELVEHGFIDRDYITGGRGGGYYVVTLLQLPPAFCAPGIDQESDQSLIGSVMDGNENAIGMPQNGDFAAEAAKDQGSILPVCIKEEHDSCQEEESRARSVSLETTTGTLYIGLRERDVCESAARLICQNPPGDLADFDTDVSLAALRGYASQRAKAYVIGAWKNHRRPFTPQPTPDQEERHATHQPRRSGRPEGRHPARRDDGFPANFGMEWLVPDNAPADWGVQRL